MKYMQLSFYENKMEIRFVQILKKIECPKLGILNRIECLSNALLKKQLCVGQSGQMDRSSLNQPSELLAGFIISAPSGHCSF